MAPEHYETGIANDELSGFGGAPLAMAESQT